MTEPRRTLSVDYLLLLLLAMLWGGSYSFIKVGVATIPPVTLIACRTLLGGLVLLAVLQLRGIALPRDRALWRLFAIQALFNSVVPFVLLAWAQQTIDAGLAVILNSTSPIFAFLITWAITRHEPATPRKLIGVTAGLAGIALVIGFEALASLGRDLPAQLAVVLATVLYAIAAIRGRYFKGLDPMVPAAGSLLAGSAMLVPVSLIIDRPWTLAPSAASLTALGGLSVLSTALAFVLFFRCLDRLGTVATTAQAYIRVPIGVGFGMLFLGETPSPTLYAGLALVVVGVAAMTLPKRG